MALNHPTLCMHRNVKQVSTWEIRLRGVEMIGEHAAYGSETSYFKIIQTQCCKFVCGNVLHFFESFLQHTETKFLMALLIHMYVSMVRSFPLLKTAPHTYNLQQHQHGSRCRSTSKTRAQRPQAHQARTGCFTDHIGTQAKVLFISEALVVTWEVQGPRNAGRARSQCGHLD